MEVKSWQMVWYFVSYDFAWVSNMVHDCSAPMDSLLISKKKERSFWLAQIWLFIDSLSCSSDSKGEAVQLHLPQVVHVLQRLAQVGSCFLVLQWVWPTLPNLSSASNLSDSLDMSRSSTSYGGHGIAHLPGLWIQANVDGQMDVHLSHLAWGSRMHREAKTFLPLLQPCWGFIYWQLWILDVDIRLPPSSQSFRHFVFQLQ